MAGQTGGVRRSTERGLVIALLFVSVAYAIAEEVNLVTYYPSPRGVYQQLLVTDKVGIGTTTPVAPLEVAGEDPGGTFIREIRADDIAGGNGPIFQLVRARGNLGARADVQPNDHLGFITFNGYTSGSTQRGATIEAAVDGPVVAGNIPGRLMFSTVGPSGVKERIRIDSNGNVGIGTVNPSQNLVVRRDPAVNLATTVAASTAGTGTSQQANFNWLTLDANGNGAFEAGDRGWHLTGRGNAWSGPGNPEQNDLMLWKYDGAAFVSGFFTVDYPTGNVGIGTTGPAAKLTVVDGNNAGIRFEEYHAGDGVNIRTFRARGTAVAPSPVLALDRLTALTGFGLNNGGVFSPPAAQIGFWASQNFTPTAAGSYITLSTTPNGSTAITERVRIDNAGNVGIGEPVPAAKLDVNGTVLEDAMQFRASGGDRLRIVRGEVSFLVAPPFTNGTGFTVTRLGVGSAQVFFTPCFGGRATVVASIDPANGGDLITVQPINTPNTCEVRIITRKLDLALNTSNNIDTFFYLIAIGPP